MHATKLLHNLLKDACQAIDKRLQRTLFEAAETLTYCKKLSIFGLGRAFGGPAKVKHTIKHMDRLLGNPRLHAHGELVYKGMTQLLLRGNKRPLIIIDWSGLTRCGAYHFLRAALAVEGRTLTLYEQAFALRDYMSDKTHRQFLKVLKNVLPENSCPIVITDAGFRSPWFKAVKQLGWDFVGRVRKKHTIRQKVAAGNLLKHFISKRRQKLVL